MGLAIYNALILKEYHKHENYKLRDVFKLNIIIFPNWMSHLTMASLLYIFPPADCSRAVGLVPISFFYFLDAVHKRGFLFGWLGFLFSYNYLLFMGFYNFALSISFFFFSSWLLVEAPRKSVRQSPYCPIYSPAGDVSLSYRLVWIGSAGDVGHCVVFGGHEAIAPTWRKQEGAEVELLNAKNVRSRAYEMLGGFLFRLKPLIRFVGYMLPAYFVLTEYYLQTLKNNDRDITEIASIIFPIIFGTSNRLSILVTGIFRFTTCYWGF